MTNKKNINITMGNMSLNNRIKNINNKINMFKYNNYAKIIFDLEDAYISPEYKEIVYKKYNKYHIPCNIKHIINTKEMIALYNINKEINHILNTSPTFIEIFNYATFLKIMEKVYLYYNNTTNINMEGLGSSFNLNDDINRNLYLYINNSKISFTLKKKGYMNEPDSIDISFIRNTESNMCTNYHIENSIPNYRDYTDYITIDNITLILRMYMAIILEHIAYHIWKYKSPIQYIISDHKVIDNIHLDYYDHASYNIFSNISHIGSNKEFIEDYNNYIKNNTPTS